MVRKNVMLDDESMASLKALSDELGMNHSEYIRHLLSGQESADLVEYHIHLPTKTVDRIARRCGIGETAAADYIARLVEADLVKGGD